MNFRHQLLARLASGCVAIVACTVCAPGFAQVEEGSSTKWLSGKALQRNQLSPVSVSWTESPLRSQLQQFSSQRRRPIFVDRRVDPTVKQTLNMVDLTTEQIVWRVAESNGLGVAQVGDLLYVGPPSSAARLPFVIASLKKSVSKLPKESRSKWNRRDEIRWESATTTETITDWFKEAKGLRIKGKVPHDVWPAVDWPSLSLVEQLSLFMVGFDGSFEIGADGTSLTLKRFPDLDTAVFRFRPEENDADLNGIKARFPKLKFSRSGKSYTAKGPVESIAKLQSWLVSIQKPALENVVERTFDLNTTARRGDILATVASQTGRQLAAPSEVAEILNQRITLELSKVGVEALVKKCLEGTVLDFELTPTKLTIQRK